MADMTRVSMSVRGAEVVTVPIDDTLTIEGQAADAKAVGEALAMKADKSELQAAIKVNGQPADAQGLILIDGRHIPVSDQDTETLANAVTDLKGKTAADIPMSSDSGAKTIAEVVNANSEAIEGMEEMTGATMPIESGSQTTVKAAIEARVKTVNQKAPDTDGNVDLSVVPLAENLQSDKMQSVDGTFIIRTTGGSSSVSDGKAYPQHILGTSERTGYVAEELNMTVIPIERTEPDEPITATIDRDVFVTYVDESGTINLYYTTEWSEDPELYGVTVEGTPVAGDQIQIVYVKEERGTILVSNPGRLVGTGWNLFNFNAGYARVVRYSDEYGYKIGGAFTSIEYSATPEGDRVSILPGQNGLFQVPGDGYVFVSGGNATDTYILATWSDWTEGPATGYWEAYKESGIDLSAVMGTYFHYGMLSVGSIHDEIDLSAKRTISRVERMAYTAENLAAAIASGREFTYDTNYIYLVRAENVISAITIDTVYNVSEHGLEWFTGTTMPLITEILYGKNLRDKLERDVLTISQQTLAEEEKAQVRRNIGVMDPPLNGNGTAAQLLKTNGDGTTEWTTQGTPTDAQVGTAVSAWLTAHPEATTTVQDGAISRAKLNDDLKAKTDAVPDLKSAIPAYEKEELVEVTLENSVISQTGNEVSGTTYRHCEIEVLSGDGYFVSGRTAANGYPLWIVFDNNENVLLYQNPMTANTKYFNVFVTIPANGVKLVVNGDSDYLLPSAFKTKKIGSTETYNLAKKASMDLEPIKDKVLAYEIGESEEITVTNGLVNINGEIQGSGDYRHTEIAVSAGEGYYLSGRSYTGAYPLCVGVDDNNDVVFTHNSADNMPYYDEFVFIPGGTTKLYVNGSTTYTVGVKSSVKKTTQEIYDHSIFLDSTVEGVSPDSNLLPTVGDVLTNELLSGLYTRLGAKASGSSNWKHMEYSVAAGERYFVSGYNYSDSYPLIVLLNNGKLVKALSGLKTASYQNYLIRIPDGCNKLIVNCDTYQDTPNYICSVVFVSSIEDDIDDIKNGLQKVPVCGELLSGDKYAGCYNTSGNLNKGNSGFKHHRLTVRQKQVYYISGKYFNSLYPLAFFFDNTGTLIGTVGDDTPDGSSFTKYRIVIPSGCVLMTVNTEENRAESGIYSEEFVEKLSGNPSDITIPCEYDHFICYGQSWSVGFSGTAQAIITPDAVNNNMMLKGGVIAWKSEAEDKYSSLIPLHEQKISSYYETPVSGQCNMVINLLKEENGFDSSEYQIIGSAPGEGNKSISELSKGTAYYQYLIDYVTACKAIADSEGKYYRVGAVSWIQGTPNKSAINQLQVDLDADIKAITGQSNDVVLITWQYEGTADVFDAYVDVHEQNENIICATPAYWFEHINDGAGDSNNIHFTSRGNKMIGEMMGIAFKRKIIDGKDFIPLKPNSISYSGKILMVKFDVPVKPLKFDTLYTYGLTNKGFNLYNSSNVEKTIESVSIFGTDTVKIVCESDIEPTDIIAYAYNGTNITNQFAPNEISHGNLCDSQQIKSATGEILPNFCVCFKKAISYFMNQE